MTLQLRTSVLNSRLDIIESDTGASPVLRIRTGTPPLTPATADSGTVLATITLPADWMSAAAAGVKSKLGTWRDLSADTSGTAGHFRIYESTGTTCYLQGTVTVTGGGGDMTLDSVAIFVGQSVTVTSFTITDGNA